MLTTLHAPQWPAEWLRVRGSRRAIEATGKDEQADLQVSSRLARMELERSPRRSVVTWCR